MSDEPTPLSGTLAEIVKRVVWSLASGRATDAFSHYRTIPGLSRLSPANRAQLTAQIVALASLWGATEAVSLFLHRAHDDGELSADELSTINGTLAAMNHRMRIWREDHPNHTQPELLAAFSATVQNVA